MKNELFDELVASVREGGAILRGEAPPARAFAVEGPDVLRIRTRFQLLPELFVGDAARGPAPAAVRSAAKAPGDRPRAARPRPRLADLLAGRFQDRPEPLRVRHDQALRNSARLTMSSAERAAASFRRRRNCSPMEERCW